jgi:ADP-heptose:LPS heptosyltransferase
LIIAKENIGPAALLVGLHPGSAPNFEWKRWPLENFAEIAAELIKKYNAHIFLFGGPGEKSLKEELANLIKKQLPITDYRLPITLISTDLLTTAALMQRCGLIIANDSGLMHLASAAGAPTLGLFGPTDEARIGPRGPQSFTLRAPGTKPVYDVNTNFNLGHSPHPSLLALKPELVLKKINELQITNQLRSGKTPRAAAR